MGGKGEVHVARRFARPDIERAAVGELGRCDVEYAVRPAGGNLDGAIAWQIMPMLWERARRRPLAGKPAPDSTRWKRWGEVMGQGQEESE